MTEKEKKTNYWIQVIENYDEITINEMIYLYYNVPENLTRKKKQKIYNLIDNICLKITGFNNKENMEYFLTRFSNSLTCKLYDLKFFIANKCK